MMLEMRKLALAPQEEMICLTVSRQAARLGGCDDLSCLSMSEQQSLMVPPTSMPRPRKMEPQHMMACALTVCVGVFCCTMLIKVLRAETACIESWAAFEMATIQLPTTCTSGRTGWWSVMISMSMGMTRAMTDRATSCDVSPNSLSWSHRRS